MRLRVENLTVEGDRGRRILAVERLTIEPGAAVGVRGPSGAGKTTLLHVLAGLLRPASGRLRWDEIELGALGDAARAAFRRDHVGMVFQDFLLFEELSALGNAAVLAGFAPRSRRAGIRDAAAAMLRRLGLGDEAGRGVASFSGGERQRVAVSRALAGDPDIMLADEPTASLDRTAADHLIADLTALARDSGRTLIAVSHDPALHEGMDRVLDIVDGRLAADSAA